MTVTHKTPLPPEPTVSITIANLINAFAIEDEQSAREEFEQAIKEICIHNDVDPAILRNDLDGAFALFKLINPDLTNKVELILTAQAVVSHLLATQLLMQNNAYDADSIANLAKVKTEAMQKIYQYRQFKVN